ncbi:MAG: hypothetical protein JWP20_2374, partial [Roseomonas sp.]|nr:hypothetical protein [Roseomonas sp.]
EAGDGHALAIGDAPPFLAQGQRDLLRLRPQAGGRDFQPVIAHRPGESALPAEIQMADRLGAKGEAHGLFDGDAAIRYQPAIAVKIRIQDGAELRRSAGHRVEAARRHLGAQFWHR